LLAAATGEKIFASEKILAGSGPSEMSFKARNVPAALVADLLVSYF
jgi:hypothetical protein